MTPEARTFTTRDGRDLTFLFNHRGIIAAEKSGDAGFGELLEGMAKGRLGYLCALIHGGLSVHQPEITAEEAWELMENEGEPLATALGDALKSAMPKRVTGAKANPPKAGKRGTGSRSSPSGSKKGSSRKASGTRRRAASR